MLSTYGKNLYAEVIAGKTAAPSSFYLALLTELPGVDDTGSTILEPAGGSYARVLISGGANWTTASGGVSTYSTPIAYAPAENWGVITSFALCTAATAGLVVLFDDLNYPVTINSGAAVTMAANTLGVGAL